MKRSWFAAWVAAACFCAALSGCQAADPGRDLDSVREIVSARTGHPPRWQWPPPDVPAETWDGRAPLTFDEALRLALGNHPAIQADLAYVASVRADLVQAGLLPNPVISAAMGWGDAGGISMTTGSLMQPLSVLWLRPGRLRATEARLRETVLRAADTALILAADVDRTFLRIRHEQTLIALLDAQRDVLAGAGQAAQESFAAGLATRLDLNRLEAEVLQTDTEQRAARGRLEQQKRRLLERMGLAEAGAEWTVDARDTHVAPWPDEQTLVTLAGRQRLDVLSMQWAAEAQRERAGISRLEAISQVQAGAMAKRESPPGGSAMTTAGPAASAVLPVFDQGQAQAARATAEFHAALMAARQAGQQAIREVREALQAAAAAEEQRQTYSESLLPLAERNVRETQAAFEMGTQDRVAVLLAERDRIAAQRRALQLQLERDLALADLARAVGGGRRGSWLQPALPHPEGAPLQPPPAGR